MRQKQALRLMMEGNSVFLTGAPGAGKTYVLNEFVRLARKQGKNVAVTASTGIAAMHIKGITIHSWSGLGIRDYASEYDIAQLLVNTTLLQRYNSIDTLVIDEVSMLHGRKLDMLNVVAKRFRQSTLPFGGIQVILVGDLFQLPPVDRERVTPDFVHLSDAWGELDPTICYLTEQHRVEDGDELIDFLSAMRDGSITDFHEDALRARLGLKPEDATVTRLYTHNVDVDHINQQHLLKLTGLAHSYNMLARGKTIKKEQLLKGILAPECLMLKRGAEVMFVANDFTKGISNGTRGKVIDFDEDKPVVKLLNGKEVRAESHTWSLEIDGVIEAEAIQLPLRLAWAITIHKSQGMSLDAAEIDLSRSFTPGMGYVALSRVRSMNGLYLIGINRAALLLHPDIFDFDKSLRTRSEEFASDTDDYIETVASYEEEKALNEALFHSLKEWRTAQAAIEGVSSYLVAHDSLLNELAVRRPRNVQALSGVKGMGPIKMEKYADQLLDLIKSF